MNLREFRKMTAHLSDDAELVIWWHVKSNKEDSEALSVDSAHTYDGTDMPESVHLEITIDDF